MKPVEVLGENSKKVKEELKSNEIHIHDFKADSNEVTENMESECVPWIKFEQEDYHEIKDIDVLRRTFGCKRELAVRIERLNLDWYKETYTTEREWQLRKIYRGFHPGKCEGRGSGLGGIFPQDQSQSKHKADLAAYYKGGEMYSGAESGAAWSYGPPSCCARIFPPELEVKHNSDGPTLKAVHCEGSVCDVQGCEMWSASSSYPSGCSIAYQSNETVTSNLGDHQHQASVDSLVPDPLECPRPNTGQPSFAYKTHESNLLDPLGQKAGLPSEVSADIPNKDLRIDSTKMFECHACKRKFVRKSNLRVHLNIHAGEKQFACSMCDKKFCNKYKVNRHMTIHTGEKPFECSVCGRKFSLKHHLSQHMKVHTGEKLAACNVCGREFSHNHDFVLHVRVHTGEKPFECRICGKKFSRKHGLAVHENVHTGERQFECNICGRKFSLKHRLNEHIKNHTGEKSFGCNVCGRKFSRKYDIHLHMRIHTSEKPFECSTCKRKFTLKHHLTGHMKIHTGEKSFECSVCGKMFSRKQDRSAHMRIHTGEKPFECSMCGKKFSFKNSLILHFQHHTSEKSL